jgi:hypothetical protein
VAVRQFIDMRGIDNLPLSVSPLPSPSSQGRGASSGGEAGTQSSTSLGGESSSSTPQGNFLESVLSSPLSPSPASPWSSLSIPVQIIRSACIARWCSCCRRDLQVAGFTGKRDGYGGQQTNDCFACSCSARSLQGRESSSASQRRMLGWSGWR